jgi:hypothetical protein
MRPINFILFLLLVFATACSTLKLKQADFAWPVESVIAVDENGKVSDDRYSISFDTKTLFFEETEDSSAYVGKKLRMLRDINGYYFITAEKFKNVYVFQMDNGAMVLNKKIFISELGMEDPALNQRAPYIELIDGSKRLYLTINGIDRNKK